MHNLKPQPPKVKRVRWSTRIACFLRTAVKSSPLAAVPLDSRALALRLGCSYQTFIRILGSFAREGRRNVWAYQHYDLVIFLRHRRHKTAKCGCPQFYAINRFAAHRIGPGAKQGLRIVGRWWDHVAFLKKLSFGLLIRGREAANDRHKASPHRESGRAPPGRSRPTELSGGMRRFKRLAATIQARYDLLGATRIDLYGWAMRRLSEWHDRDMISVMLEHAWSVMPSGHHEPVNPAAWICAVAHRHLEGDGLGRIQRWQDLHPVAKRQSAPRSTLKVVCSKTVIDADGRIWKHLGGTAWE